MNVFRCLLTAAALTTCAAALCAQDSFDALSYTARIRFDLTAHSISASATVAFKNAGTEPLGSIILHLHQLTASSIQQGNSTLAFAHSGDSLTISLAVPVQPGDSSSVDIEYSGYPVAEEGISAWGGCFWGDPAFAMGVGFYAPYVSMTRHWLPCNDVPSDKAKFDMTYIVPEGYAAAGTGLLHETVSQGNGMVGYRWIENHPTATYLVTYSISGYAVVRASVRGVPMMFYVPKTDSLKAVTWFDPVKNAFGIFSDIYGPYPFDKVGYCLTPIGSMEHQTMISFAQAVFSYYSKAEGTAIHELAHQWWGDWVTPKDFREAWLSEGFATYSEAVYAEKSVNVALYLSTVKSFCNEYRNSVEPSEGLLTLYDFSRAAPSSNYPVTIYKKGGAVLAMLRYVVGDSAFFKGLRRYGNENAWGNGTTPALRSAMETESGTTLDWFFDEWVYKPGYPNYLVQRVQGQQTGLVLRLRQIQDTSKMPLFRMPLPLMVVLDTKDTIRRVLDAQAVAMQEFSFPDIDAGHIRSLYIDQSGIILKKISYEVVKAETPITPPAEGFRLDPSHPNPVAPGGKAYIPFFLATPSHVRLEVIDPLGRTLSVVADGWYAPGTHTATFSRNDLAAGVYRVLMHVGNTTVDRGMVLK